MKIFKFLFALVLISFISNSLFAQSIASVGEENTFTSDIGLTELADENWSFYKDDENKVYYIDFEKIDFNLSEILVMNDNGEVLFQDDVLDLPVDTIYELDLSEYATGNYHVEVRSFTGVIKQEVNIK